MQYPPGIGLMTASRRSIEDDPATLLVDARLRAAGARVAARAWVPATEAEVRAQLVTWISAPAVDVVVVCCEDVAVAAAAVRPLVTAVVPGGVRCGRKLVVAMPPAIGEVAEAVERVVVPALGTPVARPERLDTDRIAVIGDLPPPSPDVTSINLRAGGRRGVALVGLAGVAAAAALCALAVNVAGRPDPYAVHHPLAAADEPAAAPAPRPVPVPTPLPAPRLTVAAPRPAPAPAAPRPSRREQPRVATHHSPAPRVTVPAELQATPPADDDRCTEDSCAAHGNVRECCTPFRAHAAALDRAHIARVTGALAATVRDCRDPEAPDGVVRVSVHVQPDGRVGSAVVVQAPEAGVGSCVAAVLRDATFPATERGGAFVYRIDLGQR